MSHPSERTTVKVLVATTETQGWRGNDFSFHIDGELVYLGFVCDSSAESPDDRCGCGRSFSGMTSKKGGTTAKVVEMDGFERDDYRAALAKALDEGGWLMGPAAEDAEFIDTSLQELLDLLDTAEVGDIIEHRYPRINVRRINARTE